MLQYTDSATHADSATHGGQGLAHGQAVTAAGPVGPKPFRQIITRYIQPLIYGAELEGPVESAKELWQVVGFDTIHKLAIAVPGNSGMQYTLKRSIPFSEEEKELVGDIIAKVHSDAIHASSAMHLLACNAVEHALAAHISPECADTVYKVLQVYNQWAGETHEGKKHAHTIGICPGKTRKDGMNFFEQRNLPSIKSLAAGRGCLLAVCSRGNLLSVETLSTKTHAFQKHQAILAPLDLADLALWTNAGGKIVIHLTVSGEILIFKNKTLLFAKRRSIWRCLPHKRLLDELLARSGSKEEEESKLATYLTMLDLAFSHSGGCIGVVANPQSAGIVAKLVASDMLFSSKHLAPAAQLLKSMVNGRKFHEIPRRLRKGLCALDGAVILDNQGAILTAGAIVKTGGNPNGGGGRSAAARALAQKGVGIKVSNDGYIEVYLEGKSLPSFA